MSKDKFTEEIKGLLADFEPQPPAQVWQGISFRLRFPKLLLGVSSLLVIGLLSFSFLSTPEKPVALISSAPVYPDRIIVLIDSSYCEDGTVRLDTVYQDLPKIDDTEPSQAILADSIIANNDFWSGFDLDVEVTRDSLRYKNGKILFRKNCSTCHAKEKDRDRIGPALYGVTVRREKEWLYNFTRQSQKMIEGGDPQALALWDAWKPKIMNNFPRMEDQQLDDIYYYIEQWEIGD
jgi:mono/diheme cytochrome c family protein